MRRLRRLVIVVAACLVALAPASARSPLDDLASVAATELRETRTPGAAIAVVKDDQLVLARGFGVADVDTNTPLRPDMLFRLGSTTKMFTAATVVTLAEEGKLKLDVPIGNYVQGLPAALAKVTAHQLLSHTAGIKDEAPMFGRHDETALGEGVKAWDASFFFTEPGRVFSYSNPGYWAAGYVAEQVAGLPYADVVADRILKPLGMTRSTFRPLMAMTYPLAIGHDAPAGAVPTVIRPAANNAATWPAGSLFSNIYDLARFAIAFMHEGRLDGKQALRAAVVQQISTAAVDQPNPDQKYAYGLTLTRWRGLDVVEHGGSRGGFGSTIRMVPREHAAVIVLANRTGASLPKTAARALESVLTLSAETTLSRPAPQPLPKADFAQYTGVYSQGAGGEIVISASGDDLTLKDGNSAYVLMRLAPYRLAGVRAGQNEAATTFVFVPGADGRSEFVYRGSRALKRQGTRPSSQ